jgi:hypothetical protein
MLRGTSEVHGKLTANNQMHYQFVTLVGAVGIKPTTPKTGRAAGTFCLSREPVFDVLKRPLCLAELAEVKF